MMPLFNKILIIGLGLIGGSLAKAIKERNLTGEIIGADNNKENLKLALKDRVIHRSVKLPQEVTGVDLIILATPLGAIKEILKQITPYLSPSTIITDVASTKEEIVKWANVNLPANIHFVGGHPMAGSEQNGFKSANPYLFEKAYYLITPTKETSSAAVDKVMSLVEGIGAVPLKLSPREHDRIVAVISHLPHMVAAALVNTLQGCRDHRRIIPLAAGGFKDTTRIASGVPEMWQEILLSNRKELIQTLDKFMRVLEEYKLALQKSDTQTLLDKLKGARETRSELIP